MTFPFFASINRRLKLHSERLFAKGSFARNLAFAFSGNATAQIIGFLFTPVITRIYTPAQYGLFALFISTASNLSSMSTLQLPTGYVTARSKSDLRNLVQLSFISLAIFTLVVTLSVILFNEQIFRWFDVGELGGAIYIIPAQVFFMGLDYILLGWNISLKEFARGAWGKIVSVVSGKSATLAWGIWLGPSSVGLILGNLLISGVDSVVKFSHTIQQEIRSVFTDINWRDLRATLKSYSSYPLLVTPGVIIVALSQQLPIFFFSHYFNAESAGYFALASTVVVMPLQMVIAPTTTVFLQKAAEVSHEDRSKLEGLVHKLFTNLFLISLISLTIFVLISELLFSFVFGDKWTLAGHYAGFIAIMMVLQVPQQPIAVLYRILNSEVYNFWLNVSGFALRLAALFLGVYYGEPVVAIASYVFVSIIMSGASLGVLFNLVGLQWRRVLPHVMIVIFALMVFFWYSQG
jgi:O-antigen/teichoic acid export membrane protein